MTVQIKAFPAHSWSVKVEGPSEVWDISSSSKQALFGPRPNKNKTLNQGLTIESYRSEVIGSKKRNKIVISPPSLGANTLRCPPFPGCQWQMKVYKDPSLKIYNSPCGWLASWAGGQPNKYHIPYGLPAGSRHEAPPGPASCIKLQAFLCPACKTLG